MASRILSYMFACSSLLLQVAAGHKVLDAGALWNGGGLVDERDYVSLAAEQKDAPTHHPRKHDTSAPLEINQTTWIWIPFLVVAIFVAMLLMTKKLKILGGLSLRVYLMRYISVETIYSTMEGMSADDFQEQRDAEWGHQTFTFFGIVFMIVHKLFNPNSDERTAFVVLTTAQIVCMSIATLFDCWMIRAGYLRSVRSVNTKLRWAHCVYQMVLFLGDIIGDDLQLPVDCFIWATIHYSYEAIGLALWALNVDGTSEMAIIALINAKIISTDVASTGWTCAFGLSALVLSIISCIVGICWKWKFRVVDTDSLPVEEFDRLLINTEQRSVAAPPAPVGRLSFFGRQSQKGFLRSEK